jgi:hypothetical protein
MPAPALTDRETVGRPTRQTPPAQEDSWTEQLRKDRERQSKRNAWIFVAMASAPLLILAGYICFAVWERRTGRLPFADSAKSSEDQLHLDPQLLKELRKLAPEEPDVAAVLKRFNLL